MKHLFIPYELAVIAKEKGFNEPCLGFYDNYNDLIYGGHIVTSQNSYHQQQCLAPLYQQIVDWLFEKHDIWITVLNYKHCEPTNKLPYGFTFYIEVYGHCEIGEDKTNCFKTNYEALNKAIEEAFKLI